ncbi:hypothetical protein BEL04_05400 [Mucilaginibacter sp. PPCGB 2223]|nr:hypothetical protein BEL04_05400 [Mucilaginibacter sp. PPCGB 2223]
MPVWTIVLFIPVFLYCIYYLSRPVKQAALDAGLTPQKAQNIQTGIVLFYFLYLAYASTLALLGAMDLNALPPRAMLYAGIPLAIFLFAFVGSRKLYKKLLQAISLEALVRLHIFRLAGAFFILMYAYHTLPARFAFFAGLGDMITAVFAFPVARMVRTQQHGWKIALRVWNLFGIMDIVDLLTVAVLTGADGNLREMAVFPYVWFPAFAPATILFLHAAVYRKLGLRSAIN